MQQLNNIEYYSETISAPSSDYGWRNQFSGGRISYLGIHDYMVAMVFGRQPTVTGDQPLKL